MTPATSIPDSPSLLVRTPPPLLFAAALAIGLVFEREAPLALLPAGAAAYGTPMAAMLLAGGAALAVSVAACFRMRHTTLNPVGEPSSLVVDGPFRATRNPIYVAVTIIVLGVSVWRNTAWPVVFLPAPLLVLHLAIIPFEERSLAAQFGDDYRAYCARVRRWL